MLDEYARTPIMLLTTESSAEMKQKGREAGASGWMVKPFDPERLLEMFRKIFG
jgi:two-component system chemotaxis response regulator CheY